MKRLNSIFLLSLLMSMIGTKVYGHDIAVENADGVTIYYNYINDGTELAITYRGSSYSDYSDRYNGTIVIPEEVTYMNRTLKVTSIGDFAFCGCNILTSVTIGNSVTAIGERAFYDCYHLTSVMVGNSVIAISDYAFSGCNNLTSIIIPNSVTSIGNGVFSRCGSLTSITIGNSVTTIGDYAFENCSGVTSVTIPNSVTSIGHGAFFGCSGLTAITIPNNVTSIGKRAFYNCNHLTSVTIPNNVTSIGEEAFSGWHIPEVISKIENPFNISTNTFSDHTFYNATLYVPIGTIDKYKAQEGWKRFDYIEEGAPSGITNTKIEGVNELKRYTLDGRVIKNSHKGVNIIRMNNSKTKKVVVK